MTDILQANPEIDVVLSNADQHLVGVEIALEAAGINVSRSVPVRRRCGRDFH